MIPDRLKELTVTAIISTSRTARGISDTSTSQQKKKLTSNTSTLQHESIQNVYKLLSLFAPIITHKTTLQSDDIFNLLLQSASIVNHNLGDCHESYWRTWRGNRASYTAPTNIQHELRQNFCPWFKEALLHLSQSNAVDTASLVEIKLNGEIHPFSDGCGRIARTLSAVVLMEFNIIPPTLSVPDAAQEYYRSFYPPWKSWQEWFRNNVTMYQHSS